MLVVRPRASDGLSGLPAVAIVRGDMHRAARVAGAAAAHRHGQPEDPIYPRLDATFFEPARTTLRGRGPARDGAALSFEDAIAYGPSKNQIRRHRLRARPSRQPRYRAGPDD
jgi:hypothetical protein